MLKLVDITKEYPLGNDKKAVALKGISLCFREKEFVSVLGHSGCGKTTLLNIIGGLDRYTTGELFINGVSTVQFKDKDWDAYRNHSVGFVFQSYNLIMHLTVVENVEMALTLVGIDRKERRERARQALAQVGLAEEANKKPNQLSGGQMQRVAIARAIINDPDILLADEPTGALDSDTSVQIMEILKKLSADRLVIMVTHNPDLAEQYSTRIVRLTDGLVVADSNPYDEADEADIEPMPVQEEEAPAGGKPQKKHRFIPRLKARSRRKANYTSMSYKSALLLSGKNLLTKRARTTLTSIAGSIGIIGIAIVLALSSGFNAYVNATAENSLSQYPLTIQGNSTSMSSVVSIFMDSMLNGPEGYEAYPTDGNVAFNSILGQIMGKMDTIFSKNDIVGLKSYLEKNFQEDWGTVKYDYDLTMHVYTNYAKTDALNYYKINPYAARVEDQIKGVLTSSLGAEFDLGGLDVKQVTGMLDSYSDMFAVWDELSNNQTLLESQYELIGGRWPTKANELVIVVDKYNHLDDYQAFTLGLANPNDAGRVLMSGFNEGTAQNNPLNDWSVNANDLVRDLHYQLLLESSYYAYDMEAGAWTFVPYLALSDDYTQGIKDIVEPTQNGEANPNCRALTLDVAGVIRLREGVNVGSIRGNIAYRSDLMQWMVEAAKASDAITAQRGISVTYTGRGTTGNVDKVEYYMAGDNIDAPMSGSTLVGTVEYYYADTEGADPTYHEETDARVTVAAGQEATFALLRSANTGIRITSPWRAKDKLVDGTTVARYKLIESSDYHYYRLMGSTVNDDKYYMLTGENTAVGEVSSDTYKQWVHLLGYAEEDSPTAISIFASSFENKEKILALLEGFADSEGGSELQYSDTVGALMSGITLIIQAITYVLIAFSSISLIVSSIMIAIITYTSVMERTKEIGILRALGARKRDITRVFNSETFIIGAMSGLIASFVTWLLSLPINAILYSYTHIGHLATIAWWHPLLLVGLSVTLTAIAGFIPSRIAAKKDPVTALRSE